MVNHWIMIVSMWLFAWTFILWSSTSTFVSCDSPYSKSCPSSCYTSIFSIANDTRHSDCSSKVNCLVQATFRVSQRGSFDEAINLTIIGYGIRKDVDRSISFVLHNARERIEYTCKLSPRDNKPVSGWVIQGSNSTFQTGTAHNSSESISCSWTFGKDDYLWPTHANYSKINLLDTVNYQISLKSDSISKVVASDLARLPIYRMNFLRCCYKPHGGTSYLFISNQTAHDTNFYLQAFPPIPKAITVTLTNPKGGEFSATCNSSNAFNATVKVGSKWSPMKDLRYYEIVKREAPFPDFRCLWSQPLVLTGSAGSVDTRNGRYNLEISTEGRPAFRESTIGLHGASYPLLASFTLIIISIAFNLIV